MIHSHRTHQVLTCEENKRVFKLHTNGFEFIKKRIDNGECNRGRTCDYLITKETQDIQIIIELKGSRIKDAFEQLISSYEQHKIANSKAFSAIVSSRFPQRDTSILVLQNQARKYFQELFIKNKILETKYNPNTNEIEKTN